MEIWGSEKWAHKMFPESRFLSCHRKISEMGHVGKKPQWVFIKYSIFSGFPWWLSCKESSSNAGAIGDTVSIPGSGRSPGEGHNNLLQYSCLENPMDSGAWHTTFHGIVRVGRDWVTKPYIQCSFVTEHCLRFWREKVKGQYLGDSYFSNEDKYIRMK